MLTLEDIQSQFGSKHKINFIQEHAFENVVYKQVVILMRHQYVNWR